MANKEILKNLMKEHKFKEKLPSWNVSADVKSSRRLGVANVKKRTISLNKKLLDNRKALKNTLLHEMAHALHFEKTSFKESSFKPHGFTWKNLARDIGADAEATSIVPEIANMKKFELVCPKCAMKFNYGETNMSPSTLKKKFRIGYAMCPTCMIKLDLKINGVKK